MEQEAVEVDKLTQLESVGEDEFGVVVREGDVGGVEGVRQLNVEAVVRPQVIWTGKGWNNADDLEEGGAVLASNTGRGVHRL